jgi:hypothetical protein
MLDENETKLQKRETRNPRVGRTRLEGSLVEVLRAVRFWRRAQFGLEEFHGARLTQFGL